MKNYHKLEKLKVILILIFITSFFLVSIIYMILKDIPVLISFLEKYFTSGNSFFFPVIPNINLFWFLPEKYQFIHLTIGQLIDIFIIISIIIHIDSSVYHYVKNVCLKNDLGTFTFLDLYLRNNAELRSQSNEPESAIELEDLSTGNNRSLNIKIGKKWILSKRINNLSNYYGNNKSYIRITRHNKFYLKLHNISNFQQKFYLCLVFIIILIYGLKKRCLPPNTNTSPNIHESITREDTKMKKKCNSSEYKIVLLFNSINN